MKFAVAILQIPDYAHTGAVQEVAETLHHGLVALGYDSVLTFDMELVDRQYILLASNLLISYRSPLPPRAIIYNLEQIYFGSPWMQPNLLDHFLQYPVWDYSQENIVQLERMGIQNVRHLPVGYVPQLTRIPKQNHQDIDVLFYGSINDRRQQILSVLESEGVKVHVAFKVYGADRDALIARAKIVLNLHFYPAKVFEVVRVFYLLANQCFVISERGGNPIEEAEFSDGVVFVNYEDLVATCVDYLSRPQDRDRIAAAGFDLMVQRPETDYLRPILPTIPEDDRGSSPLVYQLDLYRKQQALICLNRGEYGTAIDLYEQSLEVDSDCTQSYWNLGLAYWLSDEPFAAQLCWTTAISQVESEQENRISELLKVLEAVGDRFQQTDQTMAAKIQQAINELTA